MLTRIVESLVARLVALDAGVGMIALAITTRSPQPVSGLFVGLGSSGVVLAFVLFGLDAQRRFSAPLPDSRLQIPTSKTAIRIGKGSKLKDWTFLGVQSRGYDSLIAFEDDVDASGMTLVDVDIDPGHPNPPASLPSPPLNRAARRRLGKADKRNRTGSS